MMVEAVPSELVDRMCERDTGLPSMIQDGSIGRNSRSTLQLPISINARDIFFPKGYNMAGRVSARIVSKDVGNASSRFLILSYAGPDNQPQVAGAKGLTSRFPCKFAHMNPSFPGCDKVRESDPGKEPCR
jgi:hypothetical protein